MRIGPHQIKPLDTTGADLPDGQYAPVVADGVLTGFEAVSPATRLLPWTTTTSSGPELMWDDDDNLMMVEVPA